MRTHDAIIRTCSYLPSVLRNFNQSISQSGLIIPHANKEITLSFDFNSVDVLILSAWLYHCLCFNNPPITFVSRPVSTLFSEANGYYVRWLPLARSSYNCRSGHAGKQQLAVGRRLSSSLFQSLAASWNVRNSERKVRLLISGFF